MGLIKRIRTEVIKRRVTFKKKSSNTVVDKRYVRANKSHIVVTAESKKLFSENKGLFNTILKISQEIGKLNPSVVKEHVDPSGRFKLNLVNKNKILSLNNQSTTALYSLSLKNKEYSIVINSFPLLKLSPKSQSHATISSLKSDVLRKANINVISPIYSLSVKESKTTNTDKTIIIYPSFLHLKPASSSSALSFKMQDALKEVVEKLNLTVKKTIQEKHLQLGLTKDSVVKFDVNNFYVDSKTKRIYAIF